MEKGYHLYGNSDQCYAVYLSEQICYTLTANNRQNTTPNLSRMNLKWIMFYIKSNSLT